MIAIRKAAVEEFDIAATLIVSLLTELDGQSYEIKKYRSVSQQLFERSKHYRVFFAINEAGKAVGLISVAESESIYAGGKFGIIQELYVCPEYRSQNVGKQLIQFIVQLGKNDGYKRLEVGAPNAEQWMRTIEFYKREGFTEIGPRLSFKFEGE